MLAITHVGLAGLTATPELMLEDSEAKMLAGAAVPVLEQFDFTPDPRFTAVFGLIAASAQVYGPRFYLVRARKIKEAQEARARAARPVAGTETFPDSFAASPPFGMQN